MKSGVSFMWGAHFFCEIRAGARIFRGVRIFCYTSLQLKPSKYKFFKVRLKYLGHIVSPEDTAMDPIKIEAILKWPQPRTVTDVRSFTGFNNYYRKFIKGYAKIA